MAGGEKQRTSSLYRQGTVHTELLPHPVEYATLHAPGSSGVGRVHAEQPLLIWLHGGGGSQRFLETCRAQFLQAWSETSLPSMVVATPSAGWSFYLDFHDGSELWETFLVEEFIPHLRAETGATEGPVYIGGISVGALGALRIAFKWPERFAGVVAIEPTVEAALSWDRVPSRDQIYMPITLRRRLFGEPLDQRFWRANHPPAIAVSNSTAIAAGKLSIYLEAGDADRLHVHHGAELLHRCLFDVGISHEYRLTKDGNHVGPSVGPRVLEALRFLGRELWQTYSSETSIDALVEIDRFDQQARQLEQQAGFRTTEVVRTPNTEFEVRAQGEGPPVVMLPSLGRTAADFANLAERIANAGYRVLCPEPRGLTGSSSALAGITLEHLADDVAAVIRANGGEPASIVGHDFGGAVARAAATRHPKLVKNLALLAVAGPKPTDPEAATAHRRVFVPELSIDEHLEAVAVAFFAKGNDPVVWLNGWHPVLAAAQMEAQQRTNPGRWSGGGSLPTLIVRPSEDRLASVQSTQILADELLGKVSVQEVPGAGHALLPEQPAAVAVAVLTWLRRQS